MISIFNAIIAGLGAVLQAILSLLPPSPFSFIESFDQGWLAVMNWIFPVSSAVAHLEVYLSAVVVWYGLRIVMRWIKAAGA